MDWTSALAEIKPLFDSNVSLLVGAGLSMGAGFPAWQELVEPYAKELGVADLDVPAPRLMQYYAGFDKAKHSRVISQIMSRFSRGVPTPSHRLIARLGVPRVWTTNYDTLLEDAFRQEGIEPEVITSDAQLASANYNRSQLVKMHGSVKDDADLIVLLEADYERYAARRAQLAQLLEQDMRTKSFLILGFSFEDPNLRKVSAAIWSQQEIGKPHYLLTVPWSRAGGPGSRERLYQLWKQDLSRYGVQVVELNDYSEIEVCLHDLVRAVRGDTVIISGRLLSPDHETFLEELGKALVAEGFAIHTGGGPHVGPVVAAAAIEECERLKVDPISRVEFFYRQGGGSTNLRKGRVTYAGSSYSDMRQRMISPEKVCIIIGEEPDGESGMREEVSLAHIKGARVLPVAFTGSTAAAVWREERHYYEPGHCFAEMHSSFNRLVDGGLPADVVAKEVVQLCTFLARRRYE